jgi:hypothetical protein
MMSFVRTTLNIDEDVLQAARVLAAARRQHLGRVMSDLARRGLTARADGISPEDAFPVFSVDADAPMITPDMVSGTLE